MALVIPNNCKIDSIISMCCQNLLNNDHYIISKYNANLLRIKFVQMYSIYNSLLIYMIFNICVCIKLNKNSVQAEENDNSRNNYVKGYAGLGFDLVVGNPFENYNDLNTFGFRSSIIVQPLIKIDQFNNIFVKDNKSLWFRNVVNCHEDYEPSYIDNGNDLVKELFNDFSMDNPFSDELWQRSVHGLDFKNITNNSSKYKIIKCYCSLYETGLILPYNNLLSNDFLESIKQLPNTIENTTECPLDVFITEPKSDKCKNIRVWIEFFKTYGTHITTYVLIGGKFINMESTVNINFNDKINKSNVDKNVQTTDVFKRNIKGTKLKKNLWIIGGSFVEGLDKLNSKTFSKWVRTIRNRPMPIKAKFSMLSVFFPEKHDAYLSSLQYYSELIGIEGPEFIINEKLEESTK